MVSSTARPMAILAIRLVNMDSSMPSQPMMPKLMMMGNMLGIMAIAPTLLDRKRVNMMPNTRTMVMERLLIWPLVNW